MDSVCAHHCRTKEFVERDEAIGLTVESSENALNYVEEPGLGAVRSEEMVAASSLIHLCHTDTRRLSASQTTSTKPVSGHPAMPVRCAMLSRKRASVTQLALKGTSATQ